MKMKPNQLELYRKIQSFSLDKITADFPYSQRLASENNWSFDYTQRVIEEYKKFTFLAVIASGKVTPSKIIDEAWHLHLLYTHSYWNEFCPHILGYSLHHNPSDGTGEENQKYEHQYQETVKLYQEYFGCLPPQDIWGNSDKDKVQSHFVYQGFQLSNLLSFSSTPKSVILVIFSLFLSLILSSCQQTVPNPLNFSGPNFWKLI
ncbi:MAG: hypothetical protein QNJ42_15850 [Crocosphaera sp.]|nr:hypothetical protein [Crocosphaera sp.]